MNLEESAKRLEQIAEKLPGMIEGIAKDATLRAIEKATDLTPPTADDLRGTNARSGEMKQHWSTDSKAEPVGGALSGGEEYHTFLNNDKKYSSYVNDGHRMDRHFVPGLYINPESGLLEYDADYGEAGFGLVVGTKTSYVKGLYMTEAAKKEYSKTVAKEAKKLGAILK